MRGITEWNEGKLALEDALYRVDDLPLWFLSAGQGIEEPMPLLESARFAKMLETVSSSFDWVLLDATPHVAHGRLDLAFPPRAMACWWWYARDTRAARC